MSSRTQSRKQNEAKSRSDWLESLEARLNPPMSDDDEVFDPFAHLPDGNEEQVAKLRLMFAWTPPRERMH